MITKGGGSNFVKEVKNHHLIYIGLNIFKQFTLKLTLSKNRQQLVYQIQDKYNFNNTFHKKLIALCIIHR